MGRSWIFWQFPSAILSRQSAGGVQGWNEKGFGSQGQEMKVAKTLPRFALCINFPGYRMKKPLGLAVVRPPCDSCLRSPRRPGAAALCVPAPAGRAPHPPACSSRRRRRRGPRSTRHMRTGDAGPAPSVSSSAASRFRSHFLQLFPCGSGWTDF